MREKKNEIQSLFCLFEHFTQKSTNSISLPEILSNRPTSVPLSLSAARPLEHETLRPVSSLERLLEQQQPSPALETVSDNSSDCSETVLNMNVQIALEENEMRRVADKETI